MGRKVCPASLEADLLLCDSNEEIAMFKSPSSCVCTLSIHLASMAHASAWRVEALEGSIGPKTTRPAVTDPMSLIASSGTHIARTMSGLINVCPLLLHSLDDTLAIAVALSW